MRLLMTVKTTKNSSPQEKLLSHNFKSSFLTHISLNFHNSLLINIFKFKHSKSVRKISSQGEETFNLSLMAMILKSIASSEDIKSLWKSPNVRVKIKNSFARK